MITVGAFEAKTRFSALLELVEQGQEIRITRRGKPVARLIQEAPVHSAERQAEIEAAIKGLREIRTRVKPGPGWRELRDDGRKY